MNLWVHHWPGLHSKFYPSQEHVARPWKERGSWEGKGRERRGDEKVERSGEELVLNFIMHCKAFHVALGIFCHLYAS